MGPNEMLAQLREWVAEEARKDENDMSMASELFEALDEWLSKSGHLPDDWNTLR